VARLPSHREGRGRGKFIIVDTEPEKEDNTDRSDIKKRSLSALWGGSREADGELLGGTHLTRLTRDLLVALDLKSSMHVKEDENGRAEGFGRPRTCDILHKRSRRGFSSSRFPLRTCRPDGRLKWDRGRVCDGPGGVWMDRGA
jgi:hypothetical protein